MNQKLLVILVALVVVVGGGMFAYQSMQKDTYPEVTMSTASESPAGSSTASTSVESPAESSQAEEPQRVPAPDIAFFTADQERIQFSDRIGKPIIVNFWASWCSPCKSEMPVFEQTYQEYSEEIDFMMINLTDGIQETLEDGKKFVEAQGYTFPVYYDLDKEGAIAYQIMSIPTTYFIDAEGYIVAGVRGAIDEETLQRGIDLILSAEATEELAA